MDIEKLSSELVSLKAQAFDLLVSREYIDQQLQQTNQKISELSERIINLQKNTDSQVVKAPE